MLSEKDYNNIESYLSKELQGEQKTTFEAELRSRSELMEEARLQRKISQGLQILAKRNERQELTIFLDKVKAEMPLETAALESKVISFEDPISNKNEVKVIPMWQTNTFRMALAASFVGALAVGNYYLFLKDEPTQGIATNKPKIETGETPKEIITISPNRSLPKEELLAFNDNQKLADSYYTDLPKFRSDVPSDLVSGIEAYYANKPEEAIKQLSKRFPTFKSDNTQTQNDSIQNRIDNLTLYRGLSHFKNKEALKAIQDLSIASKSEDIIIHEFADWYLALAYLKNNQITEAKKTLEEIRENDDSRFNGKALEILGKIK